MQGSECNDPQILLILKFMAKVRYFLRVYLIDLDADIGICCIHSHLHFLTIEKTFQNLVNGFVVLKGTKTTCEALS